MVAGAAAATVGAAVVRGADSGAGGRRVIVLGGGVAGLAAAFEARDRGYEVELWESRGWLGGRAFSPKATGAGPDGIDNGPHVLLGCYEHMRWLLRRLGTEQMFDQAAALALAYVEPGGARSDLALSRMPAPLALPLALLRVRGVPLSQRIRALAAMSTVAFGARRDRTLAQWLAARGQRGKARSYFWDPLCRAIMNAEAEQVSAAQFLVTLRRAFLGSAARAAIWAPTAPWSEILDRPARLALEDEGIQLHTGRRVSGIERDATGRVVSLVLEGSQSTAVEGGEVISAMPWHALARLLDARTATAGSTEFAAQVLAGAPIVSVYFELASAQGLPTDPVVALVDGDPFHFYCRAPGTPATRFALLSGGRRDLDGVSTTELEARARQHVATYFPAADAASGVARVVKENRATFVAAPGTDALRPPPGRLAGWSNLSVCGDWTATGLPSTLEGAAESGRRAARAL